jgi:hypothetical protein
MGVFAANKIYRNLPTLVLAGWTTYPRLCLALQTFFLQG